MTFTVGQQLFDGQIIVAQINPDASVVITLPEARGPNGPLQVLINPNVALANLQALLDALLPIKP